MNHGSKNNKDDIVLYKDKKDCCGCGSCMNTCKMNAIQMTDDEYGFSYPVIDKDKCIGCGKCIKACAYQKENEKSLPLLTYAAAAKDEETLKASASGGIFASLAKSVLNADGVVYGCSMENSNNKLIPRHIRVNDIKDLHKLQGSKYVQSIMGNCYSLIKKDLQDGKTVLFSGTPCQVDAVNAYLENKEYPNLITIDIICHGVPGIKMFQDYIHELEKKVNGKISNISFRDKTNGWGLRGSIDYINSDGKHLKKMIPVNTAAYYKLFLKSEIYRENCYSCKYASNQRISDITIGDYWGIEQQHPEYLVSNGGDINTEKGVSCLIINTANGEKFISDFGTDLLILPSDFEKAAQNNAQLNSPSQCGKNRELILNIYKDGGYSAVEQWYFKQLGFKKYVYMIWNALPVKLQKKLKKR